VTPGHSINILPPPARELRESADFIAEAVVMSCVTRWRRSRRGSELVCAPASRKAGNSAARSRKQSTTGTIQLGNRAAVHGAHRGAAPEPSPSVSAEAVAMQPLVQELAIVWMPLARSHGIELALMSRSALRGLE